MRTLSVLIFLLLPLAGCLSADQANERFDEWLADHDSCDVPEDCALIYPGCPLGCAVAVRAESEGDATDKAESLIRRYESGGRSCDYDCMADEGVDCVEGVCAVLWAD